MNCFAGTSQRKAVAVKIARELQESQMTHPLASPLLAPLQADVKASASVLKNRHSVAVLDSRGSQFVSRSEMEVPLGEDGDVGSESPASSRRASSSASGQEGDLRQVRALFAELLRIFFNRAMPGLE